MSIPSESEESPFDIASKAGKKQIKNQTNHEVILACLRTTFSEQCIIKAVAGFAAAGNN